jgi:hypothetical protein
MTALLTCGHLITCSPVSAPVRQPEILCAAGVLSMA